MKEVGERELAFFPAKVCMKLKRLNGRGFGMYESDEG